jgi:hypothetical protein
MSRTNRAAGRRSHFANLRADNYDSPVRKLANEITKQGGDMEFVLFEDVDGREVFVNPERVIWVREYPGHTTMISCGHDDKFMVRLAPAQAVAALGRTVR